MSNIHPMKRKAMITTNKIFGVGLLALLAFVLVDRCIYTVRETETAITVIFGEPKDVQDNAGLHFKLPWANVVKIDKRNLEYDLDNAEEISDVKQERLTVDAFARYRITEPQIFYESFKSGASNWSSLRLNGEEGIKQVMRNALRQTLGEVTIEDIVTNLRAELMTRMETRMQAEVRKFGVQIIDVKIRKADYPDDIAETVYLQMRSKRQENAQLIRSEGTRDSTRIRAEADRKRVEIIAKANQEALEIKGAADAKRNAVFNEAYNRDAEFFAFYRSLQAYEAALQQGETTILLSPDSEFFKYFNDLNGKRD